MFPSWATVIAHIKKKRGHLSNPAQVRRRKQSTYHISDAVIGARIPWIQIDVHGVLPRAVLLAQIQAAHADHPIGRRAKHRHSRQFVVDAIGPEIGRCIGVNIRIPQTGRFDKGPKARALGAQLGLQQTHRTQLGHRTKTIGGYVILAPK